MNRPDRTHTPRLGSTDPAFARYVQDAATGGAPLMLFHVDIDHFRSVNETMGMAAGDMAIALLGQHLSDAVGADGQVWRLTGDEFLVVVPRAAHMPAPEAYGEYLHEQAAAPLPVLPYTIFLTVTVGVALCPEDASEASALLRCAEYAVDQAKQEGLGLVRRYAADTAPAPRRESVIAHELADAVASQQLHLLYQPQVNAHDGRVVGMEALLRWQSPSLGTLASERFMQAAEELGLIVQIGDWAMREACHQARRWRDQGFDDFEIAINVSTLQLLRSEFVMETMQAVREAGIPAHMVVLELRQSAFANDAQRIRSTLSGLRSEGIRLTLDDFGMGVSNLDSLVRYSVDKIKIGHGFVHDVTAGDREAAIACAVIAMGHQLGMKVMAHGVETDTQLGFLRRNQCDIFQGHLFGEPMPAEAAGQLLRRRYLRSDAFVPSQDGPTLLLLDDEENILRALARLFRRDGYRVLAANNVQDAFDLLATNDVQVILSDQRMSDMSGTEFLGRVKRMYPGTVRLVLSGYTDLATVTEAINRGEIYRFLTKPWNDDELREHIRLAFAAYAG